MNLLLIAGLAIAVIGIIILAVWMIGYNSPPAENLSMWNVPKDYAMMRSMHPVAGGELPNAPHVAGCGQRTLVRQQEGMLSSKMPVAPEPTSVDENTPLEIRMLYKIGCHRHQLAMLFDYMAKEHETTPGVKFTHQLVFETDAGELPRILKYKRENGATDITYYGGLTDYGALQDWIFDDKM